MNLIVKKDLFWIDKMLKMDYVVEINISDDESVKRILGRASCKPCGINYNLLTQPKPKDPEKCDICGEGLFKRIDDNEDALRKRLEIYHRDTEPILEHYTSIRIDGEKDIKEVTQDILDSLSK
jgi:adenylate kinase